jgi:tetratricopeptide (TPR) repeat protein
MQRSRIAELSAEAQRRSELARSPLVEKLSVVADFDPGRFAADGDYPAVEQLFCEALASRDGRPGLMLSHRPRVEALAGILRRGGENELARTRRAAGPLPATALQLALDAFTLGEDWPLAERDGDGLVASLEVLRWATDAITLAGLAGQVTVRPGRELIEGRLSVLELTRALRKLVGGGFVGRTAELDRLRGYCGERSGGGSLADDPPMLVHGIGGIGKSTLIARFVLDLAEAESAPGQQTAWAYLDFDRPTLSALDPAVLLRDVSRQIAAQFPGFRSVLQDQQAVEQSRFLGSGLEADTSAWYREAAFDLASALRGLRVERLVVVLDTFEEAERRGQQATDPVFGLFAALASAVPRFKLVVSGRGPARAFAQPGRPDRDLALAPLQEGPAVELLSLLVRREADLAGTAPPQVDDVLARDVVRLVGGIPLTLRLAARVLVHEGPTFSDVVRARALDRVRAEFVRGFLYQRLLNHLAGVDPALGDTLRQVARASLVLRRVTQPLVESVLLPALVPPTERPAADLYRALASEVALAEENDGALRLRPELRGPALAALRYDDPDLVRRVHQIAAKVYAASTAPDARAELAYHRLGQGEPPSELGDLLDDVVLRSLEPSLDDLPEAAARTLREALRDAAVLGTERELRDLERTVQPTVEAALRDGRLKEARRLLAGRAQRTEFTPLWRLESRLHEAEGNLPEAVRAAELDQVTAAAAQDVTRFAEAAVRLAALLERSGESHRAVQVLRDGEASALLTGYPEVRLELLLNRMNTGERGGVDDPDERWSLELDARSLLQRANQYALAASTALTRLLAAALGEGDPERIREAARVVGLGHEEDRFLVGQLIGAIAAWDAGQSTPGALAARLKLRVNGRDAASLEATWWSALSGLGTEAGRMLDRLWRVQAPPPPVLAALREIYLRWGVSRPAAAAPAGEGVPDSPAWDWSGPELRNLEGLLAAQYTDPSALRYVTAAAGLDQAAIPFSSPPREAWRSALEWAAENGKLRDLVQTVLDDESAAGIQDELRALLQADPGGVTATLRLHQSRSSEGRHQVQVSLDGAGAPVRGTVEFGFTVPADGAEAVRWYFEDSLDHPPGPAAAGAERLLAELGAALFTAVFGAAPVGRRAWTAIRSRLGTVRVEVSGGGPSGQLLPWELLRDPERDSPVALQVASFVRVAGAAPPVARALDSGQDRLRVLLVASAPGAEHGAFRPAGPYLADLGGQAEEVYELDVLRPSTLTRLAEVLESAAAAGRPYHVVHYDGYGTYAEERGYLAFPGPDVVDGQALGALLARTEVPVLLLNACQSWQAEAPGRPRDAAPGDGDAQRAFAAVAAEAVASGLRGAVALPYRLPPVTAAQFTVDLYRALRTGQPLGAAVTAGRRQLSARPERSVAFPSRPVQDWPVPVVWEPAPLALLPARPDVPTILVQADQVRQAGGGLPGGPDAGFYGRDETLLELDRAFDGRRVVLLHGDAGAGKSATAAEFARWYTATGGLGHPELGSGAVVWASFDRNQSADRVIGAAGDHLAPLLEAGGITWAAVSDPGQRRDLIMQVARQVPTLWVWDGVGAVAGPPEGNEPPWPQPERRELARLLQDLAATRARILLTSRRDEREWLDGQAGLVPLPPLPMRERVQLARALAGQSAPGDDVDWRPLLRFAGGNPLAITVLVRQALLEGSTSSAALAALAGRLRAGGNLLGSDEAQGRSRALGASLSYSLTASFSAEDRARLGMLSLFQEAVDADALAAMGHPGNPYQVPELAGLGRADAIALLDRATGTGLLTALGVGYYRIHSALPWYLGKLRGTAGPEATRLAEAAYCTAMAAMAAYYHAEGGSAIAALRIEEANLLRARALALRDGLLTELAGCMQGLSVLYENQARPVEWRDLVEELIPALTNLATGGPLDGHQDEWAELMRYRVGIAAEGKDLGAAERLQRTLLAHRRESAAGALSVTSSGLADADRRKLADLGVAEGNLGLILRNAGRPECADHLEQAVELFDRAGDRETGARVAADVGLAFLSVPALRDLDSAERWYRRSLGTLDQQDGLGRARVLAQLGRVAYERYRDGRTPEASADQLRDRLAPAVDAYQRALASMPADAIPDRAAAHGALGLVYADLGDVGQALTHLQESVRHYENVGDRYSAGISRYNIAAVFADVAQTSDAQAYAQAALRDFEAVGAGAAQDAEDTRQLLARLEG